MKLLGCVLLQVAVVLVLCWLCDAATGGCSRYGHACWGGHGKRSSHDKLAEKDVAKVLDRELDREAEEAAVAEAQEPGQDGEDDAEAPPGEPVDAAADAHRRPLQVARRFGLNALADYMAIPSGQVFQEPESTAEESDEEVHRLRQQNRRRHKSRDNDLQVLIIPNEESQTPDLHIYKILGHAPRRRV